MMDIHLFLSGLDPLEVAFSKVWTLNAQGNIRITEKGGEFKGG